MELMAGFGCQVRAVVDVWWRRLEPLLHFQTGSSSSPAPPPSNAPVGHLFRGREHGQPTWAELLSVLACDWLAAPHVKALVAQGSACLATPSGREFQGCLLPSDWSEVLYVK